MRIFNKTVTFILLAVAASSVALAQDYPNRSIRFIVPWPAGGLNDVLARAYNERVAKSLGQAIVNDFKPGAGGRIGVELGAKAAPDGYTLVMGNLGPLTIYPHLYKNMPYDAKKSFVPVTMFAVSPLVLVVNNALPVKSVQDLFQLARAKPGQLNFASVGTGTAQHLIFEMFRNRDNIQMLHVPYKGTNESLPAMYDAQIQAMFDTLPSMLPHIRSGKIRALAVTTPKRLEQLPEVPTMAEAGYPAVDVFTWYAVMVPAGTPKDIVNRLYAEYTGAAQTPEVKKFLLEQGLVYLPNTPEQFAQRMEAESQRWEKLIREGGIKVE